MADLDHFKELNDTYGHETGDRALRLFARVLRDSVRTQRPRVALRRRGVRHRLPRLLRRSTPRGPSTRSRAQLDAAITVGGLPKFTASFGVTDAEQGEDLAAALGRADDALLTAKRQGRDRVVLHDALVHVRHVGRRRASTRLRQRRRFVTGSGRLRSDQVPHLRVRGQRGLGGRPTRTSESGEAATVRAARTSRPGPARASRCSTAARERRPCRDGPGPTGFGGGARPRAPGP